MLIRFNLYLGSLSIILIRLHRGMSSQIQYTFVDARPIDRLGISTRDILNASLAADPETNCFMDIAGLA